MSISVIKVAIQLKDKLIIFVSRHKDQIYDVAVIDCVLNPIRANRVKAAIEKL